MRDRLVLPSVLVILVLPGVLGAVVTSSAAQSVDPADLVKQGQKLAGEGKHDAALDLFRQALDRAPDLYEAHLGAGTALDLKGSYKEAREHFQQAIQTAPDGRKNQALVAMGVSYAFDGNQKSAATFLRQAFDRQMTEPDLASAAATANALGRVYLESGDLDNAFKWYQTGYETSRRQAKLPGDQVDLWDLRWAHAQSRIAARRGNAGEARKQMAVVKALVDKATNPGQQIQYPYLAGYVDFYLKDYAGAIVELQQADQTDPFILVLLAQAYEKSRDAAHAREFYTKVLASNAHTLNNAFARPVAAKNVGSSK